MDRREWQILFFDVFMTNRSALSSVVCPDTSLYRIALGLKTKKKYLTTDIEQQSVDLTINCDGKQFRAHKVVIAAVSEVVEREAWMSDEVTLRAIQANVMQKLIDYCYTQMLGPFTSKHEVTHRFSDM